MSLPIYLSVKKSSTYVDKESERIRQTAAEEWQSLGTVFILLRPFLAGWFLLLHTSRWIYLSGCYLMLFFAWVVRVTVGLFVGTLAILVIAWFLDPSLFKVSPTYVPDVASDIAYLDQQTFLRKHILKVEGDEFDRLSEAFLAAEDFERDWQFRDSDVKLEGRLVKDEGNSLVLGTIDGSFYRIKPFDLIDSSQEFIVKLRKKKDAYASTLTEDQAVKLHKAVGRGHREFQYLLALMFSEGDVKATKWLRKAAEQGHPIAQGYVGYMYAIGLVVAKDEVEAAKWLLKAAEQGQAPAQYHLALMYSEGVGVTKDDVKATIWLRKAAEQGHREAQANLDVMYASDIRAPKSNQIYDYSTPSTTSSSTSYNKGYQPRVSQDDVEQVMQGVYHFKSQQQMVDVSGYTRGETYVQSYQRQPPGGINNFEAEMWALGVGAAIYGVDYASQKYDNWSAKREAKARQKAQQEAEEQARKEQQEFLAKWEAEERAREKAKKKSWWGSEKKEEEPENPWSVFEKKSWWD